MVAIILKWHQTISWNLGFGHGKQGRAYRRPWWASEPIYALSYTYAARGVKIQALDCPVSSCVSAGSHEADGFAVVGRHQRPLNLRKHS
jgi:hypothetical protein